jgi:hypothetical protein
LTGFSKSLFQNQPGFGTNSEDYNWLAPIGNGNKNGVFPQIFFFFLVFIGLVAVTVFALRPVMVSLQETMAALRDNLVSTAEEFTGRRLEYGSLGLSVFGTLDLRNVRVLRYDGSVMLSVSRLRLSYSLLDLLRGKAGGAFRVIHIDRPVFSLDFDKDRDMAELFSSDGEAAAPGRAPRNFSELLPGNFQIRLRNGEWEAAGAAGRFVVRNLGLDAAIRQGRASFRGRWNAAGTLNSGSGPGLGDMFSFSGSGGTGSSPLSAVMTGRVSGEYIHGSGEGRAAVTIPSLSGDNFRFKPVSVSVLFRDGKLEARKVYDKSPSDISFVWVPADGRLAASFAGENFSPRDLFALTGDWKAYDAALALRLSGRASLEREGGRGLTYSVDLLGGLPGGSNRGITSFSLNAAGDDRAAAVREFSVNSSWGNIRYSGSIGFSPLSPNGILSVEQLGLGGDESPEERMSAEFSISTQGPQISIFGDNLRAGNTVLSAVDGVVIREENGFSFGVSALRFRNTESYGDVRLSSLSFEGSADYNPRQIQASLRLEAFSVRDMLELVRPLGPIPSLSGIVLGGAEGLSVTTEIFFTTDYEHILYNAPRFVAVYEGPKDILVAASLSGTDQRIRLEGGLINWGEGAANIDLSADFSDADDISFSFQAAYRDFAYYAEGSILDRRSVSVRGSYGFQIYLSEAGMGSWSGYVQGESIPVPFGDQFARLGLMISIRYDSPEFWSMDIERFEIADIATPADSVISLRFTGRADQNGAGIWDIVYDDGRGMLRGNIDVLWDPGYQNFDLTMDLADGSGNEWYKLNASYGEGKLKAGLSGQAMRFARFLKNARNAGASGTAEFFWEEGQDFSASAELSSMTLTLGNQEVTASASLVLNSEQLLVRNLKMNYGSLEAVMPFFRIDRQGSLVETSAEVHGAAAGRGVDLVLHGNAEFSPISSWFYITDILKSFDGSLVMDTARYGSLEADEPFSFEFSSEIRDKERRIVFNGGPRNMIRFRYSQAGTEAGDFYAALSGPSPIRGSFTGSISTAAIDARTGDLYVDLNSLWGLFPPQDTVAFPGGIVTASVRVVGPLGDPEFYGSAKATSIRIQVPGYITEDIRPVPVAIAVTGNEMSFGPVDAVVGNGSGIVSAWFRFDRWIPKNFNLDIWVPPEDPIPFGFDISGVLADGDVSGQLNLAMEDMIFTVSGDLTAHNTEISLNSEEIAASETFASASSGITTVTDIRITTGKRVEFFYPSVELPILQAYTDLGTGIHITSDEVSRRFTFRGDVRIRSGEIFYLERNFYIREGTLFFNENELQFDPRISARAEIRDQSEEGPVTISMIIDNAPLRSFTPRFESNPPLSQTEIFSFLGQNPQGNAIITAGADILTQFTVMRRLQRIVRNFFNLDMFSVRTQVLQNMVFQAAGFNNNTVTPGGETIEKENRVGNYFNNTTVFLGKYIGSDIFVQSLFSFKYDENKQTWGGISLVPEIGMEMRNPLFNIQFNMMFLHPENWFIEDVSFTLTWRRSFF